MAPDLLLGFVAGLAIAVVTAPVGVSGAVFLLPVQLSVLHVANPAVTPTNLLFNVVAGPGALIRYRHSGQLTGPLARQLLAGTLPGVVLGATVRVVLLPGSQTFRIIVGVVLVGVGSWIVTQLVGDPRPVHPLSSRTVLTLSFAVGILGGVYGIGGGSILSPILVGSGLSIGLVAPAALTSTFVTSIVGALTYWCLSWLVAGSIAPSWTVGVACGLGGLIGGNLGALIQPALPERPLRLLLGVLACAVGALYLWQGLT